MSKPSFTFSLGVFPVVTKDLHVTYSTYTLPSPIACQTGRRTVKAVQVVYLVLAPFLRAPASRGEMTLFRRILRQRHQLLRLTQRATLVSSLSAFLPVHCITENGVQKANGINLPVLDYSKPAFLKQDITVIFVLGGPGAGKGTQCNMLVKKYPEFKHISAGDLLREERNRPGSQYGELINDCIAEGRIVPFEITINLLKTAMSKSSSHKFLIDGFPRAVDQGVAFEKAVCESTAVIFYDCPESALEERLLKRGKSSGRVDDNVESIRKRFKTFVETTLPVLDYYQANGVVRVIDSQGSPDAVFTQSCKVIEELSVLY